jgi:hypothetical protein
LLNNCASVYNLRDLTSERLSYRVNDYRDAAELNLAYEAYQEPVGLSGIEAARIRKSWDPAFVCRPLVGQIECIAGHSQNLHTLE